MIALTLFTQEIAAALNDLFPKRDFHVTYEAEQRFGIWLIIEIESEGEFMDFEIPAKSLLDSVGQLDETWKNLLILMICRRFFDVSCRSRRFPEAA